MKVKIKQFRNKAKEPVAGLTPEHAIYDTNGTRLDAKLGNINLQEFRDLQQQSVNAIKNQETQSIQTIVAKGEEILSKSDASKISFNNTSTNFSASNVQNALEETDSKVTELESELTDARDLIKHLSDTILVDAIVLSSEYFNLQGYQSSEGYSRDINSICGEFIQCQSAKTTYKLDIPENYKLAICVIKTDGSKQILLWFSTVSSITIDNAISIAFSLRKQDGTQLSPSDFIDRIGFSKITTTSDIPDISSKVVTLEAQQLTASQKQLLKDKLSYVYGTDLSSQIKFSNNIDLKNPIYGWIRYSNGEYVASEATQSYLLPKNKMNEITATLCGDTNVLCAIAFYKEEDYRNPDNYIKEASIPFVNKLTVETYTCQVPDEAKYIFVVSRRLGVDGQTPFVPTVIASTYVKYKVSELQKNLEDVEQVNHKQDIEIETNCYYKNALELAESKSHNWISFKDYGSYLAGQLVPTASYITCYKFVNLKEGTLIQFFAGMSDTLSAAIAFYNSIDATPESYIQDSSIQFKAIQEGYWYTATVPENCKLMLLVARTQEGYPNPILKLPIKNVLDKTVVDVEKYKEISTTALNDVTDLKQKYDFGSPFEYDKFLYHYGMAAISSASTPVIVPSQSVFDVQKAARLGFKYIELNTMVTADNKYVTTHGQSAALGHDFTDLEGNDAYGVKIKEHTLSDLKTNYRYRSIYPKYRTSINTLEEVLYECKKRGISAIIQYQNKAVIDIAKGILGGNFIVYNCNRQQFNGMILNAIYPRTKEEVINNCKAHGAPYICTIMPTDGYDILSESDDFVRDLVNGIHAQGCLAGFAYRSPAATNRLFSLGFDMSSATSADVNNFSEGNLINLHSNLTYENFETDGNISEDGTLSLSPNQYVRTSGKQASFLLKSRLYIHFTGKLQMFGDTFISDGSQSVLVTNGGTNMSPNLSITAIEQTTIYSIDYAVSNC